MSNTFILNSISKLIFLSQFDPEKLGQGGQIFTPLSGPSRYPYELHKVSISDTYKICHQKVHHTGQKI